VWNGRKYLQNIYLERGLYPKFIRYFSKSIEKKMVRTNTQTLNNQILKMGKGFEWPFLERRHRNSHQIYDKNSVSLTVREMQSKLQ
jgi:hypothetical protein